MTTIRCPLCVDSMSAEDLFVSWYDYHVGNSGESFGFNISCFAHKPEQAAKDVEQAVAPFCEHSGFCGACTERCVAEVVARVKRVTLADMASGKEACFCQDWDGRCVYCCYPVGVEPSSFESYVHPACYFCESILNQLGRDKTNAFATRVHYDSQRSVAHWLLSVVKAAGSPESALEEIVSTAAGILNGTRGFTPPCLSETSPPSVPVKG